MFVVRESLRERERDSRLYGLLGMVPSPTYIRLCNLQMYPISRTMPIQYSVSLTERTDATHTERGRRAYRHVERTVTRLCKRTCKRTSLHKVDTYAYPSAPSCAEGRAYRHVERTVTQTVQTYLISRRHVPIRAHCHAQRAERTVA